MSHIRVLNIGAGTAANPTKAFESAESVSFTRLDADHRVKPDVVHDIMKPLPDDLLGKFDFVFASHVLEHISWRAMVLAMFNISKAAKEDGKLYFIVPDFEWACKQVLLKIFDYGVLGVFFGGQDDDFMYHKCGFTKDIMNISLYKCGFIPILQKTEPYEAWVNEKKYLAWQIVTIAERDKTREVTAIL